MRAFTQKQKQTQKGKFVNPVGSNPTFSGQSREAGFLNQLQRTIGNQAVQRLLRTDLKDFKRNSGCTTGPYLAYDLSGRTTLEGEAEKCPGPVSRSLDAAIQKDVGIPLSGGAPTPAPAPPVSPPSSPPPRCTIATRTLVSAPGGSPDTRKTVGVNEQVEMTSSVSATWTASAGSVTPARGTRVTWTAPPTGATCSITATPATGSPCSVSMTAIPPSARSLTKQSGRSYTAGLAGSGFVARVTIIPQNVSFSRIEVREESVNAVATGYYNKVLHWNGLSHPTGSWIRLNASNSGIIDTVGTNPPGTSSPFSAGTFSWPIPQSYRIAGSSGGGNVYSTGTHTQVMAGSNGAETTSKEGASRSRTP